MSNFVLQAHGLSVGYSMKGQTAIEIQSNLDIQLHQNQLTALIGRNGIGKSTLLRTLCGLQKPVHGQIQINGVDLNSLSNEKIARHISVVLTENVDTNRLTVEDVIAIGRHPYTNWLGLRRENDDIAIQNALSNVKIGHLRNRRLQELSDGERQRVWIAKALAQETPIIMLDEPTSHLDYTNRIEIFTLLQRLSHDGKSILISTHEIDLALKHADQIWIMHDGIEQNTPEGIENSGILESVFGYTKDARHILA